MKAFLQIAERISRWIVGVSMAGVAITMTMQVFFRYILIRPLAWTDTMMKFSFVWCVFFGAFIGVRKKMHVALDMLVGVLPKPFKLLSTLLSNAMVVAILALSAFYGYRLFNTSMTSLLPAVNIPLAYLYLPFTITCVLSIFGFIDLSVDAVRDYRGGASD